MFCLEILFAVLCIVLCSMSVHYTGSENTTEGDYLSAAEITEPSQRTEKKFRILCDP